MDTLDSGISIVRLRFANRTYTLHAGVVAERHKPQAPACLTYLG